MERVDLVEQLIIDNKFDEAHAVLKNDHEHVLSRYDTKKGISRNFSKNTGSTAMPATDADLF